MKSSSIAAVLLPVLLLTGGCMPFGKKKAESAKQAPVPSYVRIKNNNWSDVNIYAVRLGTRYRLGTVVATRHATFKLPPDLGKSPGEIRLMVDPIGSRRSYYTPSLHFFPGQDIEMTVENHLPISSVSVYE